MHKLWCLVVNRPEMNLRMHFRTGFPSMKMHQARANSESSLK
jgi:hypothetical protein